MKHYTKILPGLFFLLIGFNAFALDVKLTPKKDYIDVRHDESEIRVQRIQDQSHTLTGSFSKTSRKCPPFCSQPINVAEGVRTVGEVEIFNFMEKQMKKGTGVIVDARLPSWHKKGTIPGSINIPFTVFNKSKDSSELISAMKSLNVERRKKLVKEDFVDNLYRLVGSKKEVNQTWDYSNAHEVIVWCNGPWCGQSPRAIRNLLTHGYPAEKIYYYRGGMQMWQLMGILTVK